MTSRDLKTAGEMFLYLYSCSGFTNSNFQATENGKWFINWFTFYNDLIQSPPDLILLTLNRMMKSTDNNAFEEKFFKRIARFLHMKFKRIRDLLPGKEQKRSNITSMTDFDRLSINTLNDKGRPDKFYFLYNFSNIYSRKFQNLRY